MGCKYPREKSISSTYISVDFLIIFHFPKIHVINHQGLPHGEFTLGQCAQHPLVLCESEENDKTVYELKRILPHTFMEIFEDKVQGRDLRSSLTLPPGSQASCTIW